MTVAAAVPLSTPEEGIKELEHAHSLGLKVTMIPSFIRRPVPRLLEEHPEFAGETFWLDNYAIDSPHDYDPFWAKCIELGFPVGAHTGGMGLHDRSSVSNYMHNHMGHFAAAGELLAKGLLMGGVTRRFPQLRVVLLEGGVINGARLYTDIVSRWQVRAIMSFDLGHWDVNDMEHAAAEAYKQLEKELMNEDDFRNFAFKFSIQLYAGPNADFFKGTRIEDDFRRELAEA
ncbi:MAG: amidohydrolase family protein [bacterium]|nr:hypothetical protein [Gammaproteobacteria bacterium]HIL98435.1 hypothetical protein [Pseudomonadales bacterium]